MLGRYTTPPLPYNAVNHSTGVGVRQGKIKGNFSECGKCHKWVYNKLSPAFGRQPRKNPPYLDSFLDSVIFCFPSTEANRSLMGYEVVF